MNLLAVIYHSRTRMDIERKSSSAASRVTVSRRQFFMSASYTLMHGSEFFGVLWVSQQNLLAACCGGWIVWNILQSQWFRALNTISCVLYPRLSLLWRLLLSDIEFSVGNFEWIQNKLNQKCNRQSKLNVTYFLDCHLIHYYIKFHNCSDIMHIMSYTSPISPSSFSCRAQVKQPNS